MRVNYVGELGWELHLPMEQLLPAYEAVMAAGATRGIRDVGIYAIESMRLDKCYRSWKQDLETGFSAFEASLDRFVDLAKPDFVGKAALLAERERGVRQRLVPLTLDEPGEADAPFCAPVHAGGERVGLATSGFWSFTLERSVALAYVRADLARPAARSRSRSSAAACRPRSAPSRSTIPRTPGCGPEPPHAHPSAAGPATDLVYRRALRWSGRRAVEHGGVLVKLVEEADSVQIVLYRSLFVIPVVAGFMAAPRRRSSQHAARSAGTAFGAGACAAFITFVTALTLTTVANAAFVLATTPFAAALLGRLILGEPVRRATWLAMALAASASP